jgi:hypothetical protein
LTGSGRPELPPVTAEGGGGGPVKLMQTNERRAAKDQIDFRAGGRSNAVDAGWL